MNIKWYIEGILTETWSEEGFLLFLGKNNMTILELFDKSLKYSYQEKTYLLPNGTLYQFKISTDPLYQEVLDIMKEWKDLMLVELYDGNAKLQIEC